MSTSSSLQLDRLEELTSLRCRGARAITCRDRETMVGMRFDDGRDLVARGGNAGQTGSQHNLLTCNRRVDVDHQLLRNRVGTVELDIEGARPSRPTQPA